MWCECHLTCFHFHIVLIDQNATNISTSIILCYNWYFAMTLVLYFLSYRHALQYSFLPFLFTQIYIYLGPIFINIFLVMPMKIHVFISILHFRFIHNSWTQKKNEENNKLIIKYIQLDFWYSLKGWSKTLHLLLSWLVRK